MKAVLKVGLVALLAALLLSLYTLVSPSARFTQGPEGDAPSSSFTVSLRKDQRRKEPARAEDTRKPQPAGEQAEKYPWRVNTTGRDPREVHHVVFVKVHKAASTTMYNIFLRFCLSRELNIMFPKIGHILSTRTRALAPLAAHPPSPPFVFDMLVNHVVLNLPAIRRFFPNDTRYVAIVRKPWEHVQSAYNYFRNTQHLAYLRKSNSFEEYISQPEKFEPPSPLQSLTNNRMSIDLGLPLSQVGNASHVSTFLRHLDSVFSLVLLAERFEESVLLLKRSFHWTTKDILFMSLNSKSHKEAETGLERAVKKQFRQFDHFDVALYEHFAEVFEGKLAAQAPDFWDELEVFKDINTRVSEFCDKGPKSAETTLDIPASLWNEQFSVSLPECSILDEKEMVINEWAKKRQLARLASRTNS